MVNPEQQTEDIYSVWAFPPDDLRHRLRGLMYTLRSEFGGPEFDPHVTVVGALRLHPDDALRHPHAAAAAAASLRLYSARVASVSRGTFFYQCVYLLLDPFPEAVDASALCCSHYGYVKSTPYIPHLSLLYGDLTDEEKEKARARAEELADRIVGMTFEISKLGLYKTDTEDKSLKSWEEIAVCDLTENNKVSCTLNRIFSQFCGEESSE